MKIKILFVCLGNICRSPSAEAVMKKMVADAGLTKDIFIDSAGTINNHEGEPADARMIKHGKKRAYHLDSISRPIQAEDFEKFDLIIAMDYSNMEDLQRKCPQPSYLRKIQLMMSFSDAQHEEVPDPYFGGEQGFELVLDLLEDACKGLLDSLVKLSK